LLFSFDSLGLLINYWLCPWSSPASLKHYAHSTDDESRSDWQVLCEHLNDTAKRAEQFGSRLGIAKAARLAGLLHDLGKYNANFQARLAGAKERVDHSTAGAAIIRRLGKGDDKIVAELIAYAIAGHHAGLPDKHGPSSSTVEQRVKAFSEDTLDPAWMKEITPDPTGLLPGFCWRGDEKARLAFQVGFLGRMIFSCLVDADFKDTEQFYARIDGRIIDREWPRLQDILLGLIDRFDNYMSQKRTTKTSLNRLRSEILDHVRSRAGDSPGLFTMTVPTGGGKTLASLGFALDHAKMHGHERIIYAIPFTSIIDQTASIFRKVLGRDHILEHHSAIEDEASPTAPREADSTRAERDKLKLAMEDWAAPIIVTTNVQLFESLFAARTSRSRKLHNIARSVIILDEAQTLPRPLLTPCAQALDELARNYRCSIVLCTATQPALDVEKFKAARPGGPSHPAGLPLAGRELAPDPARLSEQLKRVRLVHGGDMDDAALVAALARTEQALVIVNTRKHALALYRAATAASLDGVVHLTTRQYPAHRRRILENVRKMLKAKAPCRLIATSLVEAGVDLDFPTGWRAETGLDQVAQAAGRINREGERSRDESVLTIFRSPDNPPPPEIKGLGGDMSRVMNKHAELLSPAAMDDFFAEVYWRFGPEGLDRKFILKDFRIGSGETDFSYRSVAEKFRMIESGMVPVIIATNPVVREALKDLGNPLIPTGAIARRSQAYLVQVPPRARARLIECGHVTFMEKSLRGEQFAFLLTKSLYDQEVGLLWEDAEYLATEGLVI
jgi:CRISPR-associated endonuclease/helicase Cas3